MRLPAFLPRLPALPALQSRNYRLFFAGQLISLTGTWMQQIAMVWLAYRLTDSALVLGTVGFASQIPILLFALFAGVWNDRVHRRWLLLRTQTAALIQALALFALTAFGAVRAEWLILLAFVLGCINAIDLPARQAFVAQLVTDKADLPNAIGLNSFLMNSSRFIGPALAGLMVAAWGEALCFLLNALSYGAVLLALRAMRVAPQAPASQPEAAWTAFVSGARYAFGHAGIRHALLLVAGFGFFVTPYATMMPVFARDIFAGAADTYGFLIASAGGGSLCAALWLAIRGGRSGRGGRGDIGPRRQASEVVKDTSPQPDQIQPADHARQAALAQTIARLERLVVRAALGGALALIGFALTPSLLLAYPVLVALGFCVVLTIAGNNTLISISVDDAYRGRVMAIFSSAFLGIAPLGSLLSGWGVEHFGVRATLLVGGTLTLVLATRHALRRVKPGTTTGQHSNRSDRHSA